MPDDFRRPDNCEESRGDIKDLKKAFCRASGDYLRDETINPTQSTRFTYCDFTQKYDDGSNKTWDRCQLFSQEGFAYNLYQCKDRFNQTVICANNCKGVDPNAVVVGGTALFAAAAFSGLGGFVPAGLGLAALGIGSYQATVGFPPVFGICPPRTCRVSKTTIWSFFIQDILFLGKKSVLWTTDRWWTFTMP